MKPEEQDVFKDGEPGREVRIQNFFYVFSRSLLKLFVTLANLRTQEGYTVTVLSLPRSKHLRGLTVVMLILFFLVPQLSLNC